MTPEGCGTWSHNSAYPLLVGTWSGGAAQANGPGPFVFVSLVKVKHGLIL